MAAACNPTGAPGSTTPATTPAPSSTPLAAVRTLALEAVAVELPGRYTETQGKHISSLATPWAQETAEQLGVDLPRLARTVSIAEPTPGRQPVIVTSPAHTTGDWTYATSDTVRVYQLLPLRTDVAPFERVALLAADGPPDAQIIDVYSASWILGLVGLGGEPSVMLRLGTRIPHEVAGLWDAIGTSLRVVDGEIAIAIDYTHVGGGDPCDQRFTFRVRAEHGPVPRLVLMRQEQQEAPCAVLGTGAAP